MEQDMEQYQPACAGSINEITNPTYKQPLQKMKKTFAVAVLIIIVTIAAISCNQAEPRIETNQVSKDSLINRGRYLVTTIGCGDCHSPKIMGPRGPEPDPNRLLSGHPSDMPNGFVDTASLKSWALFNHSLTACVGPWGISYAANLTSDSTGIGNWTEDQFVKCIREGKSKGLDGARPLLPPMPWPNFAQLTDIDLKSIFAYLKSTKPVKNVVPPPTPLSAVNKKS
jgi:hypothetical protein